MTKKEQKIPRKTGKLTRPGKMGRIRPLTDGKIGKLILKKKENGSQVTN